MKYWLLKSEPGDYSIDDLKKDKKTNWSGVRNYQARNFMIKDMSVGDLGIFYHSNAEPPGAVGVLRVQSAAKADPTALDKKSKYFDEKATSDKPIWECVDVAFVEKFKRTVELGEMRERAALKNMLILKKGNRLSITPLTKTEFETLQKMGSKE